MILKQIADRTVQRVAELKKKKPLAQVMNEAKAFDAKTGFRFEEALRAEGLSFICELKKASPSKGVIAESFPYLKIAKEYEKAGAEAISVLTEPYWFQGRDEYLAEISKTVDIPILRKDFIVDSYQIYEAKIIGASAVLLIVALHDLKTLRDYLEITHSLGLSALVEAHTEEEVKMALDAGARVIGVNNRNLKDFKVDMTRSLKLRSLIPEEVVYVSESGIKTPADVALLKTNKVDAVLIGETLMRSENKKQALSLLRGE